MRHDETCLEQSLNAFFHVTETKERRPRREWDIPLTMGLNRVKNDFKAYRFLRLAPNGKGISSCLTEDPVSLGERLFWISQVEQPKIHHYGIETAIRKRKGFCIAFLKLDVGILSVGLRYHHRREINSDDLGATLGSRGCHVAWTRRHVQQTLSLTCLHGIQKRLDCLRSKACKGLMVLFGDFLPPCMLE